MVFINDRSVDAPGKPDAMESRRGDPTRRREMPVHGRELQRREEDFCLTCQLEADDGYCATACGSGDERPLW